MLRRYSSRGVETINIESRRTIGRSNCDINVDADGVSSPHVAIELHPFTRSYWLRELSLTGSTTVNGRPINGQIELHSGDLIRLGSAQPLVFEEGSIFRKISSEMRTNSPSAKYSEPISNGILPVLGHRMEPQQARHRMLNGSRSNSRTLRPKRNIPPAGFRDKRLNATAITPISFYNDSRSSAASIDSNSELSPRATNGNGTIGHNNTASVGNSLLQRVVRLQSEISRKDEEIFNLLHQLKMFEDQLSKTEKRPALLFQNKRDSLNSIPPLSFELEMYRCFIDIITQKLHTFNEMVISYTHKDYADIFLKFSRSLEEPFAVKMTEIEEGCRSKMYEKGFDELQLSRLRPFLVDDQKEHISALAQELEVIFPVIRDATSIARESISVCQVFTQWSRHLGDNLRSHGLKSSVLHHAIDCLKEQFALSEMSRHWLPPSVAPLFRLIALEAEKRESKREKDTQTEQEAEEVSEHSVRMTREESLDESEHNELVELILQAENKSIQLQKDIDSLSESIQRDMKIDSTTEHQLEELCSILAGIGSTLQHFTEQNVEVKHEDVQEGIQELMKKGYFQQSRENEGKRDLESREEMAEEHQEEQGELGTKTLEALCNRLFSQLSTEPSSPSFETIPIRKDLLEDLIFIAQQFSQRLESPKSEESLELEDDGEVMHKVTVRSANVPIEKVKKSLENIEEGDEDVHSKVSKQNTIEEKEPIYDDEVFGKEKYPPEHEAHESRKTSVTSLGVISSEEYVKHREELESPKMEKHSEEAQSSRRESVGETEVEVPVEPRRESLQEIQPSRRESLQEIQPSRRESLQEVQPSRRESLQEIQPSRRESLQEIQHSRRESAAGHEEKKNGESQLPAEVPLIAEIPMTPIDEGLLPAPIAGQLDPIPRPKSARPRSSVVEVKMGNGNVKTGSATVKKIPLALELKDESFDQLVESAPITGEKKDWTSEGTTEEVSLSETTPGVDSPASFQAGETMNEEEIKLMEARRKANNGLADSILNSTKPKSICEIPHNAHIQSHINTATRHPVSYTKVPEKAFDFFNSPPSTKKKVKIEEKPPLRQPRMQFKL